MAQYCDSAELERHWFHWLVASATPVLEPYRSLGLLWTQIPQTPQGANLIIDPCTPQRQHCIAIGIPHYFSSEHGQVSEGDALPDHGELRLDSDHPMHRLDLPFLQQGVLVPQLRASGYFLEPPTDFSWNCLIDQVSRICSGVSRKFNPPSEEELGNLTNEALTQVMRKMRDRKLVYTPGRAPVFNLLTTTIHRCLFSVMNRESRQRRQVAKLREDLHAGIITCNHRSLRVPGTAIRA